MFYWAYFKIVLVLHSRKIGVLGVFPIRRNPIRRKNRTPYLQLHF